MFVEAEILLAIIREDEDEAQRPIDTLLPGEIERLSRYVSVMGQLLYSQSRQLRKISSENGELSECFT